MIEKVSEKLEETAMVQFMSRFDEKPFLLRFQGREYRMGEAYMDGDLVIEGDLYPKKIKKKRLPVIMISAMIFTNCGWMKQ